jgi:hypothetical protein
VDLERLEILVDLGILLLLELLVVQQHQLRLVLPVDLVDLERLEILVDLGILLLLELLVDQQHPQHPERLVVLVLLVVLVIRNSLKRDQSKCLLMKLFHLDL